MAGFTRDGAEQQLAQVGLNASFYPIYNDGSYVSGCVAYCSEEPGAMVEVGSTIIVYMAADGAADRWGRYRIRYELTQSGLPERAGRFFDENA